MTSRLREFVVSIPFLGPVIRKTYKRLRRRTMVELPRSDRYWETRYRMGGTSGSGSYGHLAQFKADFLNEFVDNNRILSVFELGCGDGAQLELANYPNYIGVDVSKTSIEMCREKFADNPNYEFYLVDPDRRNAFEPVDLALSLDVIFHLVEDEIFDAYMKRLFASAKRYVIIYSYDFERADAPGHERGRTFTSWVEENAPEWALVKRVPNRYPYDPADPDNTSRSEFFVFERQGES